MISMGPNFLITAALSTAKNSDRTIGAPPNLAMNGKAVQKNYNPN